ncbi:TBC1 domain family member 9like, partial [Caligus rogercresseyi]
MSQYVRKNLQDLPQDILHHVEGSDSYFIISEDLTLEGILHNWNWIERELSSSLADFDVSQDVTEFVTTKINSLSSDFSSNTPSSPPELPLNDFEATEKWFHKAFAIPESEERLVYYYSCTFWKGRFPHQGWMYLTVNNLAFHYVT